MLEEISKSKSFIGYEYKDITVERSLENVYSDGYENFGWKLEKISKKEFGNNKTKLKFKRDRKIRNKAELTRLQRQFDSCIKEIANMEKSAINSATITVCIVGIIGTVFMTGGALAFVGGHGVLGIILAIPALIGWIMPYFLYKSMLGKKMTEIEHLIESKNDEIYEVCERANSLLVH